MQVLVCVKRVPMVGGQIVLTADLRQLDTRLLGFTVSPHEECAVEEAVRIVERDGGSVTVLTLGPPESVEQLRDMVAIGAHQAMLLETDGSEWGPIATASAIAGAVRCREERDGPFQLLLFGNEAADTCDFQVGVRVAHLLGLPCITSAKHLELAGERLLARRPHGRFEETFELALPAVVSVKEGINLPRYPSLPGRIRAKRAPVEVLRPVRTPDPVRTLGLRVPASRGRRAEVLGTGIEAVPALVAVLEELGLLE